MAADFTFVTSRLATGAAIETATNVISLTAAGITHVVDCRDDYDDAAILGTSFAYLWNGVPDDGQPKSDAWYDRSVQFSLEALTHHSARVLLHCAAGINRGPSSLYAVLRATGLEPAAAEQMIRAARPQVGLAYARDADRALPILGWV